MSISDKLKMIAERMEDLYWSGVIKYAKTSIAKGKNFVVNDSADERLVSLTAYGNSLQNGTPSPSNPIPIESAKEVKIVGENNMQTLSLPSLYSGEVADYTTKKITRCSKTVRLADFYWDKGSYNFDGTGMIYYSQINDCQPNGVFTHFRGVDKMDRAWEELRLGEATTLIDYIVVCYDDVPIEEFKAFLENENVECVCESSEYTEEYLTDEQLSQYKLLHTNYPTTTIVADGEVEIEYILAKE